MRLKVLMGTVVLAAVTLLTTPAAAQATGGGSVGATGAAITAADGKAAPGVSAVQTAPGATTAAQPASPPSVGNTTQWVNCWNAYLGWGYYNGWRGFYHVTCNSNQWYRPWVKCSNNAWYYGSWYYGGWDIKLYCPVGLSATAGFVQY